MATRSAVQTAQPLRLEGAVIVFGVPPNLIEAAKPRFHRAADSIREAFSRRLGRTMKFKIEPAEDFTEISATVRPSGRSGGGGAPSGEAQRDESPLGEPPPDDETPDPGASSRQFTNPRSTSISPRPSTRATSTPARRPSGFSSNSSGRRSWRRNRATDADSAEPAVFGRMRAQVRG